MIDSRPIACSSCSARVPAAARFCPSCGASAGADVRDRVQDGDGDRGSLADSGSLACPRCGDGAQVQKVSAIVSAGTWRHAYTGAWAGSGYTFGEGGGPTIMGGSTTVEGGGQTELSRSLLPPAEPTAAFRPGVWPVAGLALGALGLVASLFDGEYRGDYFWLWIVVTAVSGYFLRRRWQDYERQRRWCETAHPAWKRALARWQLLHYCYRCDRVFIRGAPESVSPHAMMDFLYQDDPPPAEFVPPTRPAPPSPADAGDGLPRAGAGGQAEDIPSATTATETERRAGSKWRIGRGEVIGVAVVIVALLIIGQFADIGSLLSNTWLRLVVLLLMLIPFALARLGGGTE